MAQIGGLDPEIEALPRANPGEVEDLTDHARHPVRAALDAIDEVLVGGRHVGLSISAAMLIAKSGVRRSCPTIATSRSRRRAT